MNKRFLVHGAVTAAALMLAAITVLAGCPFPLNEPEGSEAQEDGVSYKNYIKLAITPPVGQGAAGSRALTVDQAVSAADFYELIVQKQGAAPGDGDRYAFASGPKGGALAVPVEEGAVYNVLLLAGYAGRGGMSPVLLQNGFAVSPAIVPGRNLVHVAMKAVEPNPADWRFLLKTGETDASSPWKAGRADAAQGLMVLKLPKYDSQAGWRNPGEAKIKIGGLEPLVAAAGGAFAFAEDPWIDLGVYISEDKLLPNPWNHKRMGVRLNAGSAPLTITWDIDPARDLPAADCDAAMTFEALYYGYSEGAAMGFTQWRIINGLNNSEFDFTDNYGGGVFVQIGAGSGKLPGYNGAAIAGGAGVIIRNAGVYIGALAIEYKDGQRRAMAGPDAQGNYFVKGIRGKVIKSVIPDNAANAFLLGRLDSSGAIMLSLDSNGEPVFRGGGTAGNPSLIGSYKEFSMITGALGGTYKLEADLDLMGDIAGSPIEGSSTIPVGEWLPVGKTGFDDFDHGVWNPFTGVFDGNSKQLSNLIITDAPYNVLMALAPNNSGIFAVVGGTAAAGEVKNLTVKGKIDVGMGGVAGGIAGFGPNAVFTNCVNWVDIKGYSMVGGIAGAGAPVGPSSSLTVKDCVNYGAISGEMAHSGGIIGYVEAQSSAARIENCTNYGTIGESEGLGGIVGGVNSNNGAAITIIRCKNAGMVTSTATQQTFSPYVWYGTGGIVGDLRGDGIRIEACENSGGIRSIVLELPAGGIVGAMGEGTPIPIFTDITFIACKNTGSVSGVYKAGGIFGGYIESNVDIIACYNTGSILTPHTGGGFYGDRLPGSVVPPNNPDSITFSACYNTSPVSAFAFGEPSLPPVHFPFTVEVRSDCFYTSGSPGLKTGGSGVFLEFNSANWPGGPSAGSASIGAANNWGVYVSGDAPEPYSTGTNANKGNFWKRLGTPGTTDYPMLYWE